MLLGAEECGADRLDMTGVLPGLIWCYLQLRQMSNIWRQLTLAWDVKWNVWQLMQ